MGRTALCLIALTAPAWLAAQQNADDTTPKRIFGIIPNYRTSPPLNPYVPLTSKQKFKMAWDDSVDRGTFILAAAFAGNADLGRSSPSFGNGVAGYAKYSGTAYADFVIGNAMTEGILPSVLHQDPRYFRRGTGSVPSRLWYAVSALLWVHADSGRMEFNYSEVAGNAAAAAIANLYYPDNRTASNAVEKLAIQIGVDMAGNVLKEFSPDLSRKLSRHRQESVAFLRGD
jgi:hypothetical protein